MPTTYQKIFLTGSANGSPINITATSSASPTAIHTAHASNIDELWLKVFNTSTETRQVTICIGGTASHQQLTTTIPGNYIGEVPILMGHPVSGGIAISAFASASGVSLIGFVNRIVVV